MPVHQPGIRHLTFSERNRLQKGSSDTWSDVKTGDFLRNIGLIHPRNLNGIKRITLSTRILFFEHEFHESHEYLHPEHWINSSAEYKRD